MRARERIFRNACVWVCVHWSCAEAEVDVKPKLWHCCSPRHTRGSVNALSLTAQCPKLPLEYPTCPFLYREILWSRKRDRKREQERERETKQTNERTNENKSEQTKHRRSDAVRRLLSEWVEKGSKNREFLAAWPFVDEFYKSVFHFLFHIIQPFSLWRDGRVCSLQTDERNGQRAPSARTTLGNLVFFDVGLIKTMFLCVCVFSVQYIIQITTKC